MATTIVCHVNLLCVLDIAVGDAISELLHRLLGSGQRKAGVA
ncbi:hypothetical protein [Microbulbifer hydrolyticus]|uniref:Uncharacterized protein n=1 Tax=Microbulbifer hydrolyticus TaxID=48074 RepID=A0AA89PB19_9GAMM|nr:hypothetical protein [Microbulbifer hydrolyticus]MBB5211590.1 hypothetical protein [Microbulbifer hydrolyticus]